MVRFIAVMFIICASCNGNRESDSPEISTIQSTDLHDVDGPYVYSNEDTIETITVVHAVDTSYAIEIKKYKESKDLSLYTEVSNEEKDGFSFQLMDQYEVPPHQYTEPNKIFVTSDIEGNFNAFYSMLIGNEVIDKDYNWTFGDSHLVICGDMFDRGENVIPALWLLYKLEKEAPSYGGAVHFILGNHDIMQLQLDIRYVHPKYISLAQAVSGLKDEKSAYKYLMSESNELIKWVRSKNSIEKIGRNLYLHGGISPELVDANLTIVEINQIIRENMEQLLIKHPGSDERANLVFGRMGPFWYRGLVRDYKDYYNKVSEKDIDIVLDHYKLNKIIVGHTIVDDRITADYNGKVIRVDIKHDTNKFTGKHEALLIEGDQYYVVNDLGEKRILE